ncbi:MAG: hypothetical protein Q9187_003712 [Circinaria calcarea]
MGRKRKVQQSISDGEDEDENDAAPAPVLKRTRGATAKQAQPIAAVARSNRTSRTDTSSMPTKAPVKGRSSKSQRKAEEVAEEMETPKAVKTSAARTSRARGAITATAPRRNSTMSVEVPRRDKKRAVAKVADEEESHGDMENDRKSYWLMKAEPESRIEKGKDVKFSIDDLEARQEPEGWDGVRNMGARNNMRSMKKGDLAFFYHSNCKVPGIAGIMEIVREHSVDESALDPEHPYYDPKSEAENPKWSLVHVEFRQKFPALIKLKELQRFAKPGGVLENLQTLRQTRLSVSRVSKKEWDFILCLVDPPEDDSEAAIVDTSTAASKLDTEIVTHANKESNELEEDEAVDAGPGTETNKSSNGVLSHTNGNAKEQDDDVNTGEPGSKDTTVHLSDLSVPAQTPSQAEQASAASDEPI